METRHIRNGMGSVRAYVHGRLDLIDFVTRAFDAQELERNTVPNGFHIETRIGDSVIVLEAQAQPRETATKSSIYVYVQDVDEVYHRALAAGATSITAPEDRPYAERSAGVRDSFGNIWYISTYTGP